jgi:hypothetical protein
MSTSPAPDGKSVDSFSPPLRRLVDGRIDVDSIPDVIQWFLDFDQQVAVIKHPRVEEVFQWKQNEDKSSGGKTFIFERAEDRLAIGIIQALAENSTEHQLHAWISQLLNALQEAAKATETTSDSYQLDLRQATSIVAESKKIPTERGRRDFLVNCWIETLCTSEARVLGWLYKEFYGHPFAP